MEANINTNDVGPSATPSDSREDLISTLAYSQQQQLLSHINVTDEGKQGSLMRMVWIVAICLLLCKLPHSDTMLQ